MKQKFTHSLIKTILCLQMLGFCFAISPVMAQAVKNTSNTVTLNFANTEIEAVVRTVAQMMNKTAIVDPRIKGTINLVTDKPVTRAQAYAQLLGTLRVAGYAAVESGRVLRVLPEADAKLHNGGRIETQVIGSEQPKPTARGEQIVTQIFRLQHESAANMLPVVRPLIAPNNVVSAYANNNSLIITDYADNLQRIAQMIEALDRPATQQLELIPLANASAVDVASTLQKLLSDASSGAINPATGAVGGADPTNRVTILADVRSNGVLVRTQSAARMQSTRDLIGKLDAPGSRNGNVNVVHLKNADAVKLAATLRAVMSGDVQGESGAGNATAGGRSGAGNNAGGGVNTAALTTGGSSATTGNAGLSERSTVQADASTNTLIITAPAPVYKHLRGIIEQLDVRRAQVYVESLIAEVTSEKAAEFGVQWMSGLGRAASGTNGNTVFAGSTFGNNNLTITSADPTGLGGAGFVLGVANGVSTILGKNFLNLGILAKALESESQANILSTPNLLMLDNEEAKITIGDNVPFITGSYANSGSTGGAASVNPFQTIERKDVGLTLKVKPQVSEGGVIKLTIYQEVSNVKDKSFSAGIITSKRTLETTVVVDDGAVVVIGGLIEDTETDGADKVPLLGDIPGLGNLFKYQTRKKAKKNLMVFLRPIVVRDAKSSEVLANDRYEGMRKIEVDAQSGKSWILPNSTSPVLPAMQDLQQKTILDGKSFLKPAMKLDSGILEKK